MEERRRRPQLILVCRLRGSFDAARGSPSPPSPRCAERMPEPTADGEPEPATTDEPSPLRATVLRIDAEPEPLTSVKVREPATVSATWENVADSESVEKSSAPCIVAEGERIKQLGLLDIEQDLIDWETDLEVELAPLHSDGDSGGHGGSGDSGGHGGSGDSGGLGGAGYKSITSIFIVLLYSLFIFFTLLQFVGLLHILFNITYHFYNIFTVHCISA